MALLTILDPYYQNDAVRDYLAATGFGLLGLLPIIISVQWIKQKAYYSALALYAIYWVLTTGFILLKIMLNKTVLLNNK